MIIIKDKETFSRYELKIRFWNGSRYERENTNAFFKGYSLKDGEIQVSDTHEFIEKVRTMVRSINQALYSENYCYELFVTYIGMEEKE